MPPKPPSPEILLVMFASIGSVGSFLLGPSPASMMTLSTANLLAQLCPTLIVICVFLCTYSVYDAMGSGVAKRKHGFNELPYDKLVDKMGKDKPEEVYLAERVQQNQLEQLPSYLVASISFSVAVNGTFGAILALAWAILRRRYASTYRSSVGIPLSNKGLGNYTIPCYFIVYGMLMASAIQALRLCYYIQFDYFP